MTMPQFEVHLLTDVATDELLKLVTQAVEDDKRFLIGIDRDDDGTGHLKVKVGLNGQWSLPLEESEIHDWRPRE